MMVSCLLILRMCGTYACRWRWRFDIACQLPALALRTGTAQGSCLAYGAFKLALTASLSLFSSCLNQSTLVVLATDDEYNLGESRACSGTVD